MRTIGLLAAALTLLPVCRAAAASSATDDARARQVLDRAGELSRTTRHWVDRVQTLDLAITDRRGGVRNRLLQMWTKRYEDDASRTILFFHEPPQARGVGFLQWVDARGPDRQWLFLPTNKRIRQITGSRKKESFVGTDFSYEDLGLMMDVLTWSADDAISQVIREEDLDGKRCIVIRLLPTDKQDVSYGALRLWIGIDDHLVYRYDFDDRKGQLKKVLLLSDIRDVDGIPAPFRLEMTDSKAGSRTVAIVREVKFNIGLDDAVFSKRHLERGGPHR